MASSTDLQRTFLDFITSQLTAHAATFVGLSLIFFTCTEIFVKEGFLPRI